MADSTAAASNTKPSASNSESTKKPNRRPRYRKNNKPRVNDKKPQADKKKEEGEEETPEESGSDGEEGEACFICTEPVDYYSVAPCNHRTCHMCTLRLRVLYKTKNCAYCKEEAKTVVFTKSDSKPFEDYKRNDTPFYNKQYGIRFETEKMFKDTEHTLEWNCPACEETLSNMKDLKAHVKQTHQRQLCDLCLRNKKIFSHEHTLYTNAQLQKHHREGDASFNKEDETGFSGHPECNFCRTRFYSADELFAHCRDKHEQCFICVRNGVKNVYYADYAGLEKHFKKEHHLCMYKECLDSKFIVFETDIDLKAHEVEEHGSGLLSRQQRAKQAEMRRVDININYSGASDSQRQRQQPQQQNFTMTAEDFPTIGGIASALPQVSSAAQRKEDWPTLGEESGRSSPNTSEENPSGAGSRSAAALDRISDLFKNFDKLVKFRQLTTSFTSLSITADDYVDKVYNLCGKNAEFTAKVLENTKDLVENRALKSDMVRTWNRKKNSSDEATPSVQIVNPRKQIQQRKKPGVWDKVESAAIDAGGTSSAPFAPLQSKTAWSTSNSRNNSEADLQQLFPALPTATSSRRSEINNLLKKNTANAWSEPSSANPTDSELSDASSSKKKKGRKGKQVLFRVGL